MTRSLPSPPVSLESHTILAALEPYHVSVNDAQVRQIRAYVDLLLRWNRAMSLTTITNPSEIVARHFGESMFAVNVVPVENCRLADVGTGAGFPGLALKILCPDLDLILIESNKKKCAFLSEVTRTLGFDRVEIRCSRFEEIRPEELHLGIITARALGAFKELLHWSRIALDSHGHLVLWLGSEDSTRISSFPDWIWQPATKLPESQRRFLLVGRPAVAC